MGRQIARQFELLGCGSRSRAPPRVVLFGLLCGPEGMALNREMRAPARCDERLITGNQPGENPCVIHP